VLKNKWYGPTFTWLLGKADVLRVSCVSSINFLFGMLNIKAAWSPVAAVEVILYPFSHRRWIPSLGYRKSSSTTCVLHKRNEVAIIWFQTTELGSACSFTCPLYSSHLIHGLPQYLFRISRVPWHNYTPAAPCSGHWCNMKTFFPFLVDPLERKRFTNFVRLLSVRGSWKE
jgi:hypothetical protein